MLCYVVDFMEFGVYSLRIRVWVKLQRQYHPYIKTIEPELASHYMPCLIQSDRIFPPLGYRNTHIEAF